MSGNYAGDLNPAQAWERLQEDPGCMLVDVRTDAEWNFVGLPDLSSLGKATARVSWQVYPDMALNRDFVTEVTAQGVTQDNTVLLICRSGQRSRDAAIALTNAGFGPCFNVAEGFEGPPDEARHRGTTAGWKARGLPWIQG